jgi:hypothetical protein
MPQSQFGAALFSGPLQADQNRRRQCLPRLNVLMDSMRGRGERRSSASQRATSRRGWTLTPLVLAVAAPRQAPAITCADTPNSCAISRAEWGRSQPSPKYKRMTFSCCGLSFPSRPEMPGRSIRSGWFGTLMGSFTAAWAPTPRNRLHVSENTRNKLPYRGHIGLAFPAPADP